MERACDFKWDWTVEQPLAALPEYRPADDGADLLAFLLEGDAPGRRVFVDLYGPGREGIGYDLEDWTRGTGEPDHAVHRGFVRTVEELRQVCEQWLSPGVARS